MNAAAETLTKASHKVAETMYKAQQAGAAAGATGGGNAGSTGSTDSGNQTPPQGGDVVDAEFVDVDNSKQPN